MDRIFDHNRLITAGTEGDDRDRNFHEVRQKAQVVHRGLRQILELSALFRGTLPTLQRFKNGFAAGEIIGAAWEVLDSLTVEFIGHAHLDLIHFVEHIQLGDGQTVETIHLNGVAADHTIEPSAAAAAAGGGAEFSPVR